MGAGLRTWLNVIILAFVFIIIIFYNGFIEGWNEQAERDGIAWEYGAGQLWHEDYDPYDAFSFKDGHGNFPEDKQQQLSPILVQQASMYPDGRIISVKLNGIEIEQTTLKIPSLLLASSEAEFPVIIGKRMAASANLNEGDKVLIRWRDHNGTFDASEVTVAGVFDTNVVTVDKGQIWLSLDKMWEITGLEGHASFFIAEEAFQKGQISGWHFMSQDELLKDLRSMVAMEKMGALVIYLILLAIALLAIFDTQVLSIFRRQKEIGTYISLGMTRQKVLALFTMEGSMYSILAVSVGGIIGLPIFMYTNSTGISLPKGTDELGVAMADIIYPVYNSSLILGTIFLLVFSATLVSFLPARKIVKMNPVEALKGKLQ